MSSAAVSATGDGETTPVSNELIAGKNGNAVMFDLNVSVVIFNRDTCCPLRWDKESMGQMAQCCRAGPDLTTHTVGSQV